MQLIPLLFAGEWEQELLVPVDEFRQSSINDRSTSSCLDQDVFWMFLQQLVAWNDSSLWWSRVQRIYIVKWKLRETRNHEELTIDWANLTVKSSCWHTGQTKIMKRARRDANWMQEWKVTGKMFTFCGTAVRVPRQLPGTRFSSSGVEVDKDLYVYPQQLLRWACREMHSKIQLFRAKAYLPAYIDSEASTAYRHVRVAFAVSAVSSYQVYS